VNELESCIALIAVVIVAPLVGASGTDDAVDVCVAVVVGVPEVPATDDVDDVCVITVAVPLVLVGVCEVSATVDVDDNGVVGDIAVEHARASQLQ
jgi:hypothetical protein